MPQLNVHARGRIISDAGLGVRRAHLNTVKHLCRDDYPASGTKQENDMKLGYDETKCVCCGKVNVNSLLIDLDEKDEHSIVCLSCANMIYKYICAIRQVTKE